MAALANTFTTQDAVGNREELSNIVSRVAPEDTPIYSMIPKVEAKSIHPEWEVDDLGTPADNAQAEGDEFVFDAIQPMKRMGDYTQIFRKTFVMSATQDRVDNAGRAEQVKRNSVKKGVEIRKDVEYSILANTASAAGTTRRSGGLPTWIESNAERGTGGANGGYDTATGLTQAATDGAQRDLTKALLDDVIQQAYVNGANTRYFVVSPKVKKQFVGFMSDANVASFRYAVERSGQNTIVSNADIYESPHGKVTVVPNRVMAVSAALARNGFLIDPDYLQWAWLRRIQPVKNLAKTGDSKKYVILGEGCLKPLNEKGLGVIADLNGL